MATISLDNQSYLQSHYLALQAAGSDAGTTVVANHLRWDLLNELGHQHIPKGELATVGEYQTTIGFNKADDFVRIYRAEYDTKFQAVVGLHSPPDDIKVVGEQYREWRYVNLSPVPNDPQVKTTILIRFTDVLEYDQVEAAIDPYSNPIQFMYSYEGPIEIEAMHKLSFAIELLGEGGDLGSPIETISKGEPYDSDPLIVSSRSDADFIAGNFRIVCENVKYYRFFKPEGFYLSQVALETYEDFIRGKNDTNEWFEVNNGDGFALSLDQGELEKRLEDASRFIIDQQWPKFNGGDALLVDNYHDRWFEAGGVLEGIQEYLLASTSDTRAMKHYTDDNGPDIAISLLDALKLIGTDFHNARMLGLGYIDTPDLWTNQGVPQIYIAEYITDNDAGLPRAPLTSSIQHMYCTIPTSIYDHRLPLVPTLDNHRYGLNVKTVDGSVIQIADPEGYLPNTNARFVNINAGISELYENFMSAINNNGERFNMAEHSRTVLFGIEYKLQTAVGWNIQEISHDTEYPAFNLVHNLWEVVPILNKENPVFTHKETQEGVHEYALYAINWFSRISGLSNIRATNATEFPKSKSLLPPGNLAAHYIQEEAPIILSTALEQELLDSRKLSNPSGDNYETRVIFYWNHVHNNNYQFADKVEFLFRMEGRKEIQGEVENVSLNSSDPTLIDVTARPILMASRGLDPVTEEVYQIDPDFEGDSAYYVGGTMACDGSTYSIEDINDSGTYPVITIRPLTDFDAIHVNGNHFLPYANKVLPATGSRFVASRNLEDMDNWAVLQKEVALVQHSGHTENTEIDGKQVSQVMGGIFDFAFIEALPMVYSLEDEQNGTIPQGSQPGDPIPGSQSGIFKAEFYNYILEPHPDNGVSWYCGTVRVLRDGSADRKVAEVMKIESHESDIFPGSILVPIDGSSNHKVFNTILAEEIGAGNLRIYVYYPDPVNEAIETGSGVEVTYLAGTKNATQQEILDDGSNDTVTILGIAGNFQGTLYQVDFGILKFDQHPTQHANALTVYFNVADLVDDPVQTGHLVLVNFHPGYRLYLQAETGQGDIFNKGHMLPSGNEHSKITWFSARAKDSAEDVYSVPANPVMLLGRKVVPPLPPAEPVGPLYATRPDFYGKASYTFDVHVDVSTERTPYALQFLKANEEAILFTLYTKDTRDSIRDALPRPADDTLFAQRWYDLVNLQLDNGQFKTYQGDPANFQFPNPDNPDYYYLADPLDLSSKVYPFTGAPDPGTMEGTVQEAIASAFVPLTEQIVIYSEVSDADRQTSPDDPVTRDGFGETLPPTDPAYNPFPMVRRFEDNGEHFVRFTDYRIDGAAQNWYFYLAREMADSGTTSSDSPIAGPIQLVNARPPATPKVQQLTVRPANPITSGPPAIQFEMAVYPATENITQITIYRALTEVEALSIRTMQKAAEIPYGDPILDDFSDLPVPPFGQPIYYRLVAQREISNEDGNAELVPSEPTGISAISVVDSVNPLPPELSYTAGTLANGELPDVVLEWNKTVHNGKYYLYKMGSQGNWTRIYELATNNATIQVDLANTDLGSNVLVKEEDGETVYHRFKVDVENASGLMNLSESDLII